MKAMNIILLVFGLLTFQCSTMSSNRDTTFKVEHTNINYISIERYDLDNGAAKVSAKSKIKNTDYINKLVKDYLASNRRELNKFRKKYELIIFYNDGKQDAMITNGHFIKVDGQGVFKMDKNLDDFLEEGLKYSE